MHLNIDWLAKDEPINFDTEPRFVKTNDYSMTITKTIELDSGMYTCLARTELDQATASAMLIVQVKAFIWLNVILLICTFFYI